MLPQGARKGKTMTKQMTKDSEVERDLRKMKTAPQALTERTITDFMRDDLQHLRWLVGVLSRPSWTHCGFERRLTLEKATPLQPPAGGSPWSRWTPTHRSLANVGR